MKLGPDFVLDAQGHICHTPKAFDETDDDLMHDVCEGPTLAEPVQALLLTLSQIKATAGSFGMDSEKSKAIAFDDLLPQLEALRAACKARWEAM
jgi:hypothetical protein